MGIPCISWTCGGGRTEALAKITAQGRFGHAASDLTAEALNEPNGALDAAQLVYSSEIHPGTVHKFTIVRY
ncbi:hypothetical protein BJD99_00740 [Rhodococcus sp. 1163]|nr:hypothetical protein BJD99_00740 [Rhodococcus sp. 1163]